MIPRNITVCSDCIVIMHLLSIQGQWMLCRKRKENNIYALSNHSLLFSALLPDTLLHDSTTTFRRKKSILD